MFFLEFKHVSCPRGHHGHAVEQLLVFYYNRPESKSKEKHGVRDPNAGIDYNHIAAITSPYVLPRLDWDCLLLQNAVY
jgi:hypothetical protein